MVDAWLLRGCCVVVALGLRMRLRAVRVGLRWGDVVCRDV